MKMAMTEVLDIPVNSRFYDIDNEVVIFFVRLVVIVKCTVVFLSSLVHKLCLEIAVSNLKSSCGFTLVMHMQKCMWLCNVCKRASGNLLSTYLLLAYVAFHMFPCI